MLQIQISKNGNALDSIPTKIPASIYSHKLCFVGSQNRTGEHAGNQVGKIGAPARF